MKKSLKIPLDFSLVFRITQKKMKSASNKIKNRAAKKSRKNRPKGMGRKKAYDFASMNVENIARLGEGGFFDPNASFNFWEILGIDHPNFPSRRK